MTLIDNGFNAVVNIGVEGDNLVANLKHSLLYGETDILDCPSPSWCSRYPSYAGCAEKHGFMTPYFSTDPKDVFPSMMSSVPIYKPKENAAWGGSSAITNVTFSNFKANITACGASQAVFAFSTDMADYIPASYYSNINFVNVA